jgi:DNA-binding transcriptional regulator LsrR (DeoR family)
VTDNNPRREQILRAAWLYHERGMNQQSIAERMSISRSTVSRLLSDAARIGIVRVTLTEPLPETARLSERLIEHFGLAGATVELTLEDDSPMETAAIALAVRIERMVSGGSVTLATGWGRTLGTAAQRVRSMPTSHVTIVDAFGHTTTHAIADVVEVSDTLGRKFGARVMHLPSPGFAATSDIARSFYESESVRATLEVAKAADAVIVAIGVVGPESLLVEADYLDRSTMSRITKAGAVGEVFGRYFDLAGRAVLPDALHPVSLTIEDLQKSRRVIAAVGGAEKADAVRGAIATGIVDELATDDTLARALLDDA